MIGARLLIVDHDQRRRELIRELAIEVGFDGQQIAEADTLERAMRAVNETVFSFCVCNLHLAQQCEGLQVMMRVREKCSGCKTVCLNTDDDTHGWTFTELLGRKLFKDYVNLSWEPDHWHVIVRDKLRKWRLQALRKLAELAHKLRSLDE